MVPSTFSSLGRCSGLCAMSLAEWMSEMMGASELLNSWLMTRMTRL